MTKTDTIANSIFKEYEKLKDKNNFNHFDHNSDESVKEFIEQRLNLHGRNGIMFHAAIHYKKQLWQTRCDEDISRIAQYVWKNNTFRKSNIK